MQKKDEEAGKKEITTYNLTAHVPTAFHMDDLVTETPTFERGWEDPEPAFLPSCFQTFDPEYSPTLIRPQDTGELDEQYEAYDRKRAEFNKNPRNGAFATATNVADTKV